MLLEKVVVILSIVAAFKLGQITSPVKWHAGSMAFMIDLIPLFAYFAILTVATLLY